MLHKKRDIDFCNTMKKKNFLVTGGTGFIGSNISKLLVDKKYNVKIFDNNSRGSINKIKNFKKKVKFVKGDIRNKKSLNNALKNIDAVYTEVNLDEIYINCARVEEIDEYLKIFGFERVLTKTPDSGLWGDALYLKKDI